MRDKHTVPGLMTIQIITQPVEILFGDQHPGDCSISDAVELMTGAMSPEEITSQ